MDSQSWSESDVWVRDFSVQGSHVKFSARHKSADSIESRPNLLAKWLLGTTLGFRIVSGPIKPWKYKGENDIYSLPASL